MKNKNNIIAFIIVSISICTYFALSYTKNTKDQYLDISNKILFQEALTLFNNIVNIRKWSSDHNGVYVLAHEGIKPNPYLENNHTYTKDDKLLIKINPAWMTRQLSEISNEKENYYFKITSLQPINPNNIPDDFEKRALMFLKANKEQKFFTQKSENSFNFFGPLKVEPSCLNCHVTQNYKLGDIMGGLRITLPTNIYEEKTEIITSKTNLLYILIVMTSIIFLSIITYTINSIYKREKNILKLNKNLEKKVKERTKELVDANEKLLKISTIDYLTNLPNRRYFFEIGKKSFFLAKREDRSLSIICIDIDFFKNVNDTYGHQIGDEILKHVSNIMSEQVRKSDTVARTGGEEFIILLNNTSEKGALTLAEKIRNNIYNTPYITGSLKIHSTISLGISKIRNEDTSLDNIIVRADEALYKAKNNGRNKTEVVN